MNFNFLQVNENFICERACCKWFLNYISRNQADDDIFGYNFDKEAIG